MLNLPNKVEVKIDLVLVAKIVLITLTTIAYVNLIWSANGWIRTHNLKVVEVHDYVSPLVEAYN